MVKAMPENKTEKLLLGTVREIDPVKTFECGQCFRWNMGEDGAYTGVAMGRAAKVLTEGEQVYIITTKEDLDAVWRAYFDLERDYEAIRRGFFNAGEYLQHCAEYGAGIRILRQERWEALCSFILSQCNNIPRIKKIITALCVRFGREISFLGGAYYTFPDAETLASLDPEDLAPLKCGYRAAYVLDAARAVASGALDLDALAASDTDTATKALLTLNGVGVKVANCAMLFGLGHLEAFPVDVWMDRALREHFPSGFDPDSLGPYAGIAQQYIFYYARSGGGRKNA